jgi:glutathione S-transferase
MKLYGFGQSRSFRCLWALEEAGIDYDYVPIKMRVEADDPLSAQHPDYLKLNQQGKVPTLVDGSLVLTESVAILYYLGRYAPDAGLLPNASMDVYARLDELMCFALAELEQPLWSNGKHRFALPEQQRIPQMLDTAKFEFAKALACLDRLLPDSEYAVADQFTIADIMLAHTFNWAIRFEFDVPPRYQALRDRHYQRPAAQRALARIEAN